MGIDHTKYTLSGNAIDIISDSIQKYLKGFNIDTHTIPRGRLTV